MVEEGRVMLLFGRVFCRGMGPSGHETSIFRAGHRAQEDFLGISSFSSCT